MHVEQVLMTCRQAQLATDSQKVHTFSRSLYTSSKALDAPVSADHGKVSTADEGDIGRGTHQAAPVEDGDPSDVVPNLVTPEDTSGQDQLKHFLRLCCFPGCMQHRCTLHDKLPQATGNSTCEK